MQDIDQINRIINGEEKELIIIDTAKRVVKINKPVSRVITLHHILADSMRVLGAKDKIVGIGTSVATYKIYLQGISELPTTGSFSEPNIEAIINLKPDLVLTYYNNAPKTADQLVGDIPVVGLSLHDPTKIREEITKLGYILDKIPEVEKYLEFHDKYIDLIKSRTEALPEEKKPRVYLEWNMGKNQYRTYGGESYDGQKITMAGGRNIFEDIQGSESCVVDSEAVVSREPDIIILKEYESTAGSVGFSVDDSAGAKSVRDTLMSRPELANVNAVKNERVYIIVGSITVGPAYPVCVAYYAKWFHPDLFKDLDPRAMYQEYLDKFCGINYNVFEHGIFVYPPLNES